MSWVEDVIDTLSSLDLSSERKSPKEASSFLESSVKSRLTWIFLLRGEVGSRGGWQDDVATAFDMKE